MFEQPEPAPKKEILPDVKHPAEWTAPDIARAGLGLLVVVAVIWIALAIIF